VLHRHRPHRHHGDGLRAVPTAGLPSVHSMPAAPGRVAHLRPSMPAPRRADRGHPARRRRLFRPRRRPLARAPDRLISHLAMQAIDDPGSPAMWASTSPTRNTTPHPGKRQARKPAPDASWHSGRPSSRTRSTPDARPRPRTQLAGGRSSRRVRHRGDIGRALPANAGIDPSSADPSRIGQGMPAAASAAAGHANQATSPIRTEAAPGK
jgi:hypothetical protein